MKFIKSTLKYVVKNFLFLFLMSVIPAIFLGAVLSPFKAIEFINTYSATPVLTFGTIFNGLLDFGILQLLLILVAIMLLAIFASAIMGQIEQQFRSGKSNFERIKEHVNNNILIILANLVAFFVIIFIFMFVTSAILFLTHLLISDINTSPTVLNVIISNIILSSVLVLITLIGSIILVNTANMMSQGTQFKDSISSSIKLTQKNSFNLTLATLAPILIIAIFVSLFTYSASLPIINILGVLVLIMYYTSLAMTSYFELAKLDRYDNRKKYYHK